MRIVRCPALHFYNADIAQYCPLCHPASAVPSSRGFAGWLVSLQDPEREWRLRAGYNYLRFADEITVTAECPERRERGAVIGFDPAEKCFTIAPGGSRIVRVNGSMILHDTQLAAYDRICVDAAQFLFVPLCGQQFDWDTPETEGVIL